MPAGRPHKYLPEYPDMLIEHMSKGFSYESFAGLVSVHKSTIYEWETSFEEFSDAKKIAFEKSRLFWEKQGIEGLYNTSTYDPETKVSTSRSLNSSVYIFNMKNRFPTEWREKQEIDMNANIKEDIDYEKLSDAALAEIAAARSK